MYHLSEPTNPFSNTPKLSIEVEHVSRSLVPRDLETYKKLFPEPATEIIFENICSFLPGALFSGFFPGGFMCSPNRYQFSRKVCLFAEQIRHFTRNYVYVFTEEIPIFQEHLFSYRTDNNFRGTFFGILTNRQAISRKVPPPNRYFNIIGLGGCFRLSQIL